MSTFVIVPGAWDTPATLEPVIEPLGSAGHDVVVVDLPCSSPDASLEEYADAVRAVLPDDLSQVVLVGYSFGGFTASRIAVDHPDVPVVYVAAWIPLDGSSVLDLFAGGDPFEAGEEAGFAAFDGLVHSSGPGLCALNIDLYVAAADPAERDAVRTYLERTQRPQGIASLREKRRGELPTSRRRILTAHLVGTGGRRGGHPSVPHTACRAPGGRCRNAQLDRVWTLGHSISTDVQGTGRPATANGCEGSQSGYGPRMPAGGCRSSPSWGCGVAMRVVESCKSMLAHDR